MARKIKTVQITDTVKANHQLVDLINDPSSITLAPDDLLDFVCLVNYCESNKIKCVIDTDSKIYQQYKDMTEGITPSVKGNWTKKYGNSSTR